MLATKKGKQYTDSKCGSGTPYGKRYTLWQADNNETLHNTRFHRQKKHESYLQEALKSLFVIRLSRLNTLKLVWSDYF